MAYVEKLPSGKWRGVYRDPLDRKRSRSFTHKAAAREWAEGQEESVRSNTHRDPKLRPATVKEFADLWAADRVVEATTAEGDAQRLKVIVAEFGAEPVESLSTLAIQGWVKRLHRKPMAAATVRKYHGLLSTMLTAAVRERLITENPCRFVQLPTVGRSPERYVTREQHAALVNALPEPYATVTYVKAYSGLRWGEIAGLHVAGVDTLRQTIVVTETLTQVGGKYAIKGYPKSKKPRRVPVPQHVIDRLALYLATYPPTPCGLDGHKACSGLVFRNSASSPLSRHNNRKMLLTAKAKTGVDPNLRPHDLRHTAASWLVQDGVPLYDVQHFLGHGSQAMAQRYSHLAPDEGGRVRQALHDGKMGRNVGQSSST